MNQVQGWSQNLIDYYLDHSMIDARKLHHVITSITAILVAGFSLYVTINLPYYPRGWLVLLIFLIGLIWFASPGWGRLIAILVYILPVASLINMGGEGLFGVIISFLLLAAMINPYSFLIFAGLTYIALHPFFFPLLLFVPLSLGFLGVARGAFVAGLAALYVEILMFLRHVPSIGVITGGTVGKVFLFPLAHPVGTLLDFSWLQNQPVSDQTGLKFIGTIFPPFVDNPSFIGQILVWAACAAIVSILLHNPSIRNIPRAVQSIAFGSIFAIIGQMVVAIALGKGIIDLKLLLISAVLSGISIFIASPILIVLPQLLDLDSFGNFTPESPQKIDTFTQQNIPTYQYSTNQSSTFKGIPSIPIPQSTSPSLKIASNSQTGSNTGSWHRHGTVPKDVWEDLIGAQAFQREIQDSIESQFNPIVRQMLKNLGIQPTRGILLYGPSGTGKSTIARIIAHETNATFLLANGSDFSNKGLSESDAALRQFFNEARQSKPSVLCFDEIDSILSPENISSFLGYLDGLGDLEEILVIGVSSQPWKLAQTIFQPLRFDKLLYTILPDEGIRHQMFQFFLSNTSVGPDVDLAILAANTSMCSGANIEQICDMATHLAHENSGNLMTITLAMSDFEQAMLAIQPVVNEEILTKYATFVGENGLPIESAPVHEDPEQTTLTWNDVAGMQAVREQLNDVITLPLARPEVFKEFAVASHKTVLLYGPAGCGKVYLARIAASTAGAQFFYIRCSDLLRESELHVRDYFYRARKNTPSVLFFDDLDIIAPAPVGQELPQTNASRILVEIDALESLQGVLIIGSTHVPEKIDPAFLQKGRFDQAIFVPLPDRNTRIALLNRELSRRPIAEEIAYEQIADELSGYTSAELLAICNTAAIQCALETAKTGEHKQITTKQLLDIIQRTPAVLSSEEIAHFEQLRATFA